MELRLRVLRDRVKAVNRADYSGIFHCGEEGDVEQVARTSITILCVCDLHIV